MIVQTLSANGKYKVGDVPIGRVVTIDPVPSDAVEHPSHYTNGKFEVIEVIEEFTQGYKPYEAYCVGNVIKYVARAPHKHETPLEDLKKARQYLDFAIKRIEGESE